MENTVENKAIYFAHHYGQKVKSSYLPEQIEPCAIDGNTFKIFHLVINGILKLTPLDQIEDVDAIAVGRMFLKGEQPNSELLYCGKIFATCMFDNDDAHETGLYNEHCQAIDYLRSRGYAVPFHGLKVQSLIDYAWLKI